MTGLRSSKLCPALILLLAAAPIPASEPACIAAVIRGADAALENAIRAQLSTELKRPVLERERPDACRLLAIALQDGTATISLAAERVYATEVHLSELPLSLWPRTIALSCAGLWILAQNPPGKKDIEETVGDAKPPGNTERSGHRGPAPPPPETGQDAAPPPASSAAMGRFRFHMLAGGRWIPRFGTGAVEISPGVGASIRAVHLDLSLVGLLGRKKTDSGTIYTTGAGFRATLFWQALQPAATSLGIGPAVEVICVFGFGRGSQGVDAHRAFSPVVNVLLFIGGQRDVSPAITVRAAIGGGATARYFYMQIDGEPISGFSGGSANGYVGFSFGRPARVDVTSNSP